MKETLGVLGLLTLVACGPTSPELAAKICEDRAKAATGPTGLVGVSASSSGQTRARLKVGVTSDFLLGRDPYEVYDSCVRRKSGQGPIRPLVLDE